MKFILWAKKSGQDWPKKLLHAITKEMSTFCQSGRKTVNGVQIGRCFVEEQVV
jgi:hypothetical protein